MFIAFLSQFEYDRKFKKKNAYFVLIYLVMYHIIIFSHE